MAAIKTKDTNRARGLIPALVLFATVAGLSSGVAHAASPEVNRVCLGGGTAVLCVRSALSALSRRDAWLELGRALERRENFESAAGVYTAALELYPRDAQLQRSLALSKSNLGEQRWLRSRNRNRTPADAPAGSPTRAADSLRRCHQARGEPAVDACREALARGPATANLHERMGDALRAIGAAEEALAAYAQALIVSPDQASARRKRVALLDALAGASRPAARDLETPAAPTSSVARIAQRDLLTQLLADGAISRRQFDELRSRLPGANDGPSSALEAAAGRSGRLVLDTRSEKVSIVEQIDASASGRNIAVVIGNDNYLNHSALRTARRDAGALASTLQRDFGFSVTQLRDASRTAMVRALRDAAARALPGDSLLIYFAGHGVLGDDGRRGYWLPVDARPNEPATWLSDAFVADLMHRSRARHVLVLADSCFSGALATRGDQPWMPAVRNSRQQDSNARRSRGVITAGALEPVLDEGPGDHSVFSGALLAALGSAPRELASGRLFSALRQHVVTRASQVPRFARLVELGDRGGEFVFRRSGGEL